MTTLGRRRVLIIVENLPVPFDRRVWQEATSLQEAGYDVSVICPTGKGFDRRYEVLDGVHIYRHPLPLEGRGALGFLVEYSAALFWQTWLAWRVFFTRGFDAIHACNPPDNIFLVAWPFKLLGRRYLFDQHDVCPEMYIAKFGRQDMFYRLMLLWERLTYWTADVVIVTNESFRQIALERGRRSPESVYIVRSGPNLSRLREGPAESKWRNGRAHAVGYLGVMGNQEGLDDLLRMVRHLVYERGREDVQFILVGGGPELEALRTLAQELHVADFVTFTGWAGDALLLSVLNSMDVCVGPDPYNVYNDKCTMNKVMEYMALGKAQVQYDLTEGRASAQDASLYAERDNAQDFLDKVLALLDDPERARAMGAFGRERVRDALEWRHEQPKLLAAYDRLFRVG